MNEIRKAANKYKIVSVEEKKWLEEQKRLRTLEQFVHYPWDFADHVHLHRIGSTIITPKDYEPEKWYKYASENAHVGTVPCMKCVCCGTEMLIDAISFNYHRHLASPNAMDYAEFKCPECGAIYRTDPFVARHHVEDPGRLFRNERVEMAWANSPEEIDRLSSFPVYSMDNDGTHICIIFFILIIIGIATFLIGSGYSSLLAVLIPASCAAIDVGIYLYRRHTTQRFYKLPEERQLFIPNKSEQDPG